MRAGRHTAYKMDGLQFVAAAALLCTLVFLCPAGMARTAAALYAPGAALQMVFDLCRGESVQIAQTQTPQQPVFSGSGESPPLPTAAMGNDVPAAAQLPDDLWDDLPAISLWGEERRPAGAVSVQETRYEQGTGSGYIPCGAGSIKNNTKLPDTAVVELAAEGLPFSVTAGSDEPQVLILHTHATETYRPAAGLWALPGDTGRSTDRAVNVCAVGAELAATLNRAGIPTLHDDALNDYPSYNGSYANSRALAQAYLARYPSIRVILDVHRDAIEADGARIAPVCTVGGRQAAQVMLICGCDNGTTVPLPDYAQNLAFAAAFEARLEADYPGLTRPVLFSYRYYNQDLAPGCLLVEIGGHGNTLNEALASARLVGRALAALLKE